MATRTIARLYDTHADATQVVTRLEAAGVPHSDISIVANNRDDPAVTDRHADHGTGATTGATAGAVIGGGAGLLAGIGALAIPALWPVRLHQCALGIRERFLTKPVAMVKLVRAVRELLAVPQPA